LIKRYKKTLDKIQGYIFYSLLVLGSFTYNTFLPEIILYRITITAITNKICIKLPVARPGTIPSIPSNQITIHITATNHKRLLIMCFLDCLYVKINSITPF
tara:strand:+ start:38099 stop:38401 length:303 start_codon:yes stop_codon:yes gene_type:complete